MPGANRHRPPNSLQMLRRIYRRQIASEKLVSELKDEVARLTVRMEINLTLVMHCRRLLHEKETMLAIIEANKFMAAALPRRMA